MAVILQLLWMPSYLSFTKLHTKGAIYFKLIYTNHKMALKCNHILRNHVDFKSLLPYRCGSLTFLSWQTIGWLELQLVDKGHTGKKQNPFFAILQAPHCSLWQAISFLNHSPKILVGQSIIKPKLLPETNQLTINFKVKVNFQPPLIQTSVTPNPPTQYSTHKSISQSLTLTGCYLSLKYLPQPSTPWSYPLH